LTILLFQQSFLKSLVKRKKSLRTFYLKFRSAKLHAKNR